MPHLNGFTASSAQSGFPQSFVAGNGIPGHQQRQQLQSQHQNQQQQPHQPQQRPASAPSSAQLQGQLQSRPGSALGHSSTAGSMPMASQAAVKAQQSPSHSRNQMDLASPTLETADTNMGLAGQQQQQAAMMRAHQAPSAGGPVMSNGKPALLRGAAARDGNGWAQGPAMVSSTMQQWSLHKGPFRALLLYHSLCLRHLACAEIMCQVPVLPHREVLFCRVCPLHNKTRGCS